MNVSKSQTRAFNPLARELPPDVCVTQNAGLVKVWLVILFALIIPNRITG